MAALHAYLADHTLEDLTKEFAIKVKHHPHLHLAILNYDQIQSPKKHPVVRECRQRVIEIPYRTVSKSFDRFYNENEDPDETKFLRDHISDAVFQEKCDGSLISIFWYQDQWRVITRGSWADGLMDPTRADSPTWESMVWSLVNRDALQEKDKTYVFELCTPYNQVVRRYTEPVMYLLAIVHPQTGQEYDPDKVAAIAEELGVRPVPRFNVATIDDAHRNIDTQAATIVGFEGMVARVFDPQTRQEIRVKIKSAEYLRMHLKATGKLTWKDILGAVIDGETDELKANRYFESWKDQLEKYQQDWVRLQTQFESEWRDVLKTCPLTKDIALRVRAGPFKTLFFLLYRVHIKTEKVPYSFWLENKRFLIDHWDVLIKAVESS